MPNPQGGRKGDLLVQTFIETPKNISSEQEEILRKLAELEEIEVLPERKNFLKRLTEYFAASDK
jgi:molecular chaperone DnaJ